MALLAAVGCSSLPAGKTGGTLEAHFRKTKENRAKPAEPFFSRDVSQRQEVVSGTFGNLKHGLLFIFAAQHAREATAGNGNRHLELLSSINL